MKLTTIKKFLNSINFLKMVIGLYCMNFYFRIKELSVINVKPSNYNVLPHEGYYNSVDFNAENLIRLNYESKLKSDLVD